MKKIVSMFLVLVLSLAMFVIPAGAAFSVDFSGLYKEIEKAANAIMENRTITYDCNGGKFISWDGEKITMTDSAVYYPGKGSHIVPDDIPTRLGYVFDGWLSSGGNVYYPGDTVSEIANVTMTAQWVRVFDLFKTIY